MYTSISGGSSNNSSRNRKDEHETNTVTNVRLRVYAINYRQPRVIRCHRDLLLRPRGSYPRPPFHSSRCASSNIVFEHWQGRCFQTLANIADVEGRGEERE